MRKALSTKSEITKNFQIAAGVTIIAILVAFAFLKGGGFGITGFLIFKTSAQSDFDLGAYNNTAYNNAGSYAQLSAGSNEGTYTSKVFDSEIAVAWNNITWGEGLPYQEEFLSDGSTLGLYHFNDDISDNAFTDSSGGHTAFIIGGVTQSSDGKFSSAAHFDGNNGSYLNITDRTAFDVNSGTIEFWFKPAITYSSGLSEEKFLYSRKVSAQHTLKISFEQNTSKLKFRIRSGSGGGSNAFSTQSTWESGIWYFAAVRWGSNGMKLYVNGVEVGTNAFTGAPSWADNGDLHIGADSDGTKTFNGAIDELRISNIQRSGTEILNSYKRGALNLRLQARSDDDNSSWGDFVGPDSTSSTYYATPLANLSVSNNRYFQYRAYFSTENTNYTPELYNVSIEYEDTVAPSVIFVEPTPNNQEVTKNWIFVNTTLNENGASATLEWNDANESMNGSGMNWYLNKTGLADGNYTFKVYATDNLSNLGVSQQRWANIDTTQPPAPSAPSTTITTTGGGGGGNAIPSAAPTPRPPATETPSSIVEETPEIPTVGPEEVTPAPEVTPIAQPEQNVSRPPPSAFAIFTSTVSDNVVFVIIGVIGLIAAIFLAVRHGRKVRVQRLQLSEEN